MASKKMKPQIYALNSGEWAVSGSFRRYRDYDSALAEFERQLELYRAPERKRWRGWLRCNSTGGWEVRFLPEGEIGLDGWLRADWLDAPEGDDE